MCWGKGSGQDGCRAEGAGPPSPGSSWGTFDVKPFPSPDPSWTHIIQMPGLSSSPFLFRERFV